MVDEIQMGFWRTGKLWSVENFGIKPDVLVFAKALTNGLNPLSGLWAREELINQAFSHQAQHTQPSHLTHWELHWVWKL